MSEDETQLPVEKTIKFNTEDCASFDCGKCGPLRKTGCFVHLPTYCIFVVCQQCGTVAVALTLSIEAYALVVAGKLAGKDDSRIVKPQFGGPTPLA